MARIISLIVLLAIILVTGLLFYRVMIGFFVPLFLAAVLVVVFRPVHQWMFHKTGGRPRVAAGLTTAAILVIVLVPMTWVCTTAVVQGISIVANLDVQRFESRMAEWRKTLGLQLPLAENLHKVEDQLDRLIKSAEGNSSDTNHEKTLHTLLERVDRLESDLKILADGGEVAGTDVEVTPAAARRALENIEWIRQPIEDVLSDELAPVDAAYVTALRDARFALAGLRSELKGGPVRGFLTDLANPSEEEVYSLRRESYERLQAYLLSLSGTATALAVELMLGGFVLVLGIYFFLLDGPTMVASLMQLSPLDDTYEQQLLTQFDGISRAVVLATLVTAVAQGVLAGIGFYFAGTGAVVLLMLLTMVLAMVPFLGAAAIWIPVSLWLIFMEDRVTAGILLALYGNFVVSMSDNFIKPWILHGQSNLHPLLGLLSVIGGVQALGPIGVLVGPMIVVFLQALLKILNTELAGMGPDKPAAEGASQASQEGGKAGDHGAAIDRQSPQDDGAGQSADPLAAPTASSPAAAPSSPMQPGGSDAPDDSSDPAHKPPDDARGGTK